MLSIYSYTDISLFLRDSLEFKKTCNSSFSLRAWARTLGFKNNTPLSLMLAGKRGVPKKYIPLFIQNLKLNKKEGTYFEALVDLSRSKTEDEKVFCHEKLVSLSPRAHAKVKEIETYHFLRNPLHMVLLEMTALKNFETDPKWIQERLSFKASKNEIINSLDRLHQLGLLKINQGKIEKTNEHIETSKDIATKAIQEYHKNISQIACNSLEDQPVLEREFNGYCFNIDPKSLPKAKEKIRSFIREFIDEFESKSGEGQETYQLSSQFFRLTRSL